MFFNLDTYAFCTGMSILNVQPRSHVTSKCFEEFIGPEVYINGIFQNLTTFKNSTIWEERKTHYQLELLLLHLI